MNVHRVPKTGPFLHCALAAAQCIVIAPVCGFVCLFVCLWVGLLPR